MKSAISELVSSTKSLDVIGGDGSSTTLSNNEKFVNKGFNRWEEIRKQWVSSAARAENSKRHAKDIDIDEVIDLIVSNRWRQQVPKGMSSSSSSLDTAKSATQRRDEACFARPVALPQMVDVLVDLWEAEGLDI